MKTTYFFNAALLSVVGFVSSLSASAADLQGVLNQIEQLENKSDPKCYATASRLEDFMFGTPLSDEARFEKHQAEKLWLKQLWQIASQMGLSEGAEELNEQVIERAIEQYFAISQDEKGHWLLKFTMGNQIKIHKDDKRQYSSIAYSLRALLAVQQESLLDLEFDNLPLNQAAINALTQGLDLFSLSALKVADQQARNNDMFEVDKATISEVWQTLMGDDSANSSSQSTSIITNTAAKKTQQLQPVELTLLSKIVEQKVRSYAAYNQISNQLFVRNLQVYFARNRWPATDEEGKAFRQMFTETLIAFAADLYKGAEAIALKDGRRLMNEADVNRYIAQFVPHTINEYEDAIFFPKLPRSEQVTIESYDMDAFRDSGIHWRYLQFAVFDSSFKAYVEPDPFAAELLVENIAQFGVLILRMTGQVGKDKGEKRITTDHFAAAMNKVQQRVAAHNKIKHVAKADIRFSSSKSNKQASAKTDGLLFSDISEAAGIDYMHRSSDWLNRLLRSYLRTGKDTATSVIPPAFGGSGVATEDINNDGLADVLILGGLGNRLYLNLGNGRFKDITKQAGLNWLRKQDNQPGEARQPLIADLNNDGLQDIVISYVNDTHRVYQNIGNAKFKDVTVTSGLGGQGLVGGPATVFDYDNDGLLDIYITYFGDYLNGVLPTLKRRNDNGLANKLFRNTGNFKFTDVTEGSNLDNTGWGQAVTHADFNNDGLQDLIVGNDFGVNAYYKNLGKGKFVDVANALGADKPSYTMGIGSADLNDDFVPDIYISNIVTMNKDEKYVMPGEETTMKFNPQKLATMRVVEANDLFISTKSTDDQGPNDGINYHLSESVGRGYSSTGWSWDADFFDSDNDGDDDLYVLNGMNEFNLYSNENPYYTDPLKNQEVNVYIPVATKESNVFFVNDGGKLNNVSKQSGVDLVGNSRSAAFFDIEGDGDLDMVINNYHEKAVVYRNNAEKLNHNWLKVSLQGAPKLGVNLDAIGAQVIVTTKDGDSRWRLVQGSTGYMSVHPKEQHFGLQNFAVANVKVKWPNGKVTQFGEVKANQTVVINYSEQSASR